MKVVRLIWQREVAAMHRQRTCALPLAAFLAAFGWSFTMILRNSEGSLLQMQTIWGMAAAPWLPVLAALTTMRLFAVERASGMLDLLLAAPLRERTLVLGKYFGGLTPLIVALLLSLAVPLLLLPALTDQVLAVPWPAYAATFLLLALQASTWCALGTLISLACRNLASAAVTALVLCCGLPLALYLVLLHWLPQVRTATPWMLLLAHVYDFSTGLFASFTCALYLGLTLLALFLATKLLLLRRIDG